MDTTSAAVEGFHEAWRRMVAHCPDGSWQRDGDVVTARTGLPVAPFNGIWVAGTTTATEHVLAAVDGFANELPWNVQLRPGTPAEVEKGLVERGFTHTADIPFMTASASDLAQPGTDLAFSKVVTFDDVGEHLRLLELAFGMPEDLTRRGFPLGMFFAEGLTCWLGRSDGEVVTTGLHVHLGDSVGVFNIATPQEHRGKGYGAAVTALAAHAGFERGAEVACLQASPLGEPVYRGLGFTTVELWQQWIPSPFLT